MLERLVDWDKIESGNESRRNYYNDEREQREDQQVEQFQMV
jgi:hypothetical protein